MSILYPYQIEPSNQLIRALTHGQEEWGYPAAVNLSDVGVGKSFMDLNAMLATGRKVIVLCPKVGAEGWLKTFAAFNASPHFLGSYESLKGGNRLQIATRDSLDNFRWKNAGEVGLILDEAQAVKGADSLASKCIDGAIAAGIPIIQSSATLASSPLELRIAGRITGLHAGGHDWERFMVEHGCRWNDEQQRWTWSNKKVHVMEQLHRKLIPQRGCRVTKDMIGERAGSTIEVLPIECEEGPQIKLEWDKGNAEIAALNRKGYPFLVTQSIRRKIRMRLWTLSERALVPHVAALMKQDLANGCSVLAFTSFTDTREALGKLMGTRDGFHGGQTGKRGEYERAMLIRDFQANRIRVLISNTKAGGSSVSLDDTTGMYPRVTYLFPSDSAQSMEQVPGRTDRVTSKSHARIWIPCVKFTLSEAMVASTAKKLRAMAGLNDGGAK